MIIHLSSRHDKPMNFFLSSSQTDLALLCLHYTTRNTYRVLSYQPCSLLTANWIRTFLHRSPLFEYRSQTHTFSVCEYLVQIWTLDGLTTNLPTFLTPNPMFSASIICLTITQLALMTALTMFLPQVPGNARVPAELQHHVTRLW